MQRKCNHESWTKSRYFPIGVVLTIVLGGICVFLGTSKVLAQSVTITEQSLGSFTTEAQVKVEIEKVSAIKVALDTLSNKNKLDVYDNLKKRAEISEKIQNLEAFVADWESLEKSYDNYGKILTQINAIKNSTKESDKKTREGLETQRETLKTQINTLLNILKKRDTTITLTMSTVTKDAIATGKEKVKKELEILNNSLKEKIKESKKIYKEYLSISKQIIKAKKYLKDLEARSAEIKKLLATKCTAVQYSVWGTCSNKKQTRTVIEATPKGCGAGLELTRDCTGNEVIDCTSVDYTVWSSCSNGVQTRTVKKTIPEGCTGGIVTSKSCGGSDTTYCSSISYSDWGTCTDGTQTRNMTSSAPTGCTEGIFLKQSCGSSLGKVACKSLSYSDWGTCTNGKQTRTVTTKLPQDCTEGIALEQACESSSTACKSIKYSDWGGCASGQKTRTITSKSPSGCTGGIEQSISCTYSGSPFCREITYSDWGACTNGQQSRTVTTVIPTGCTGGLLLTQSCTANEETMCKNVTYSDWGTCTDLKQTRTIESATPEGCKKGLFLTRNCNPWIGTVCKSVTYSDWSECVDGKQTRTATSVNPASCTGGLVLSRSCAIDPGTTMSTGPCTGFTYSTWGKCINSERSRTIVTATPSVCSGGINPATSQTCSSASTTPCTSFTYGEWGACVNGEQTRIVADASPAGCGIGSPEITKTCSAGGGGGDTSCTYSYSDWGACSNGQRTRTITNSAPQGCTSNNPITTQACGTGEVQCTSVSYSNWSTCSNGTQSRTVTSSTPAGCTGGILLSQSCSSICSSFTYGEWGTCNNGTQSRTVTSSTPAGCTGGNPSTSRTCSGVCTSFTYSDWGICSNGQQVRTVRTATPAGCFGGSPTLTRTCTAPTCTYSYSNWTICSGGQQTRSVTSKSPQGCIEGTPITTQSCSSPQCEYTYSAWSACSSSQQTRTEQSRSPQGCVANPAPITIRSCVMPTCTYTYSAWGACNGNQQTRTETGRSPQGCTPNPAPVLNQSCTPVCGNGMKEGNEECDDGNVVDNDSCSSACVVVSSKYECDQITSNYNIWEASENDFNSSCEASNIQNRCCYGNTSVRTCLSSGYPDGYWAWTRTSDPGCRGKLGLIIGVTLSSSLPSGSTTQNTSIPVTISFSKAITGLTADKFVCTNCTLNNLSGSGTNYSTTITPNTGSNFSVYLPGEKLKNANNEVNSESNVLSWRHSLIPAPVLSLQTSNVSQPTFRVTNSSGSVYPAGTTFSLYGVSGAYYVTGCSGTTVTGTTLSTASSSITLQDTTSVPNFSSRSYSVKALYNGSEICSAGLIEYSFASYTAPLTVCADIIVPQRFFVANLNTSVDGDCTQTDYTASQNNTFGTGNGTSANPYRICTFEQLQKATSQYSYILGRNLSASSSPSGTNPNTWNSNQGMRTVSLKSLNGNGYTISGLILNGGASSKSLFGTSCVIYNLKLENIQINPTAVAQNSTGIFGSSTSSGTFAGISVTGTSSVRGGSSVGGFIGECVNCNVKILTSINEASVSGIDNVGGFIGYTSNGGSYDRVINRGTISASGRTVGTTKIGYAGGIVGDAPNLGEIINSYNTGTISGFGYIGGITGYCANGRINQVYNTGSPSALSNISCYARNSFIISGSSWGLYSSVSGSISPSCSGTFGGTNTCSKTVTNTSFQGTGINTLLGNTSWDFTDIWQSVSSGYPKLKGE